MYGMVCVGYVICYYAMYFKGFTMYPMDRPKTGAGPLLLLYSNRHFFFLVSIFGVQRENSYDQRESVRIG